MVWITQTFTRRQWLTLFVFAVADFCSAICVSLQAPFYPAEAERKGATATEYGLVFGVFELTVFIVSPIMGRNLGRFGAKRVFNVGILTTGSCSILFGFLDRIENGNTFIGLSVVVRALEAVGNSGFLTASFR
jgi:MFS family permease